MFSKSAAAMAPPAVLITPATACEEGGRCNRMDFVLEAQHIRKFLVLWGRDAEKFKQPYRGISKRVESFRLSSKAAKYLQQFAERDTSSRIVWSNNNGCGENCCNEHRCGCDLPLLTELAWWFSETLKGERPERRVVRYFFDTKPTKDGGPGDNNDNKDGQSESDKEALDFLYSLIWQLVRAFPHGETSSKGVVVSALPHKINQLLTADEFREQVDKLDGTMATFREGLDLLRTCVQVAGDRITYVFDGLESIARAANNNNTTTPPRGYDPVLKTLLESSASKVHSVWISAKEDNGTPAVACKFQKHTDRPEKEFVLEPTSSDSLLRSWRTVGELKFKGNRY
ncbi:hypothetical protein PG996_010817 [Apiospora saccharicola]|uniref:Uncharacterized protein n=1 Tax=Apiospora saccharicola TaxID=335842 RepID=A0ABR1UPN9_9PEZI